MAKSRNSAITVLRKSYGDTKVKSLSTADMFRALGKDSSKPNDKSFVATQVSLMKSYGFIRPNYSTGKGYRERTSITLTEEGERVLGHGAGQSTTAASIGRDDRAAQASSPTLEMLTEATDEFNRLSKYWEWKLVRKGQPMKQR